MPEFGLTVDGSSVEWFVSDFWNKTVTSGTLPISEGTATLSFNPGAIGYFAVHLVAVKNGARSNEVIVTCAVLAETTAQSPTSPFGIATHFAQGWDINLIDLIAKAGISRLRDENYWNQIETAQGVYNFPGLFTNYMAKAGSKGVEPLMALTFGNPLYDNPYSPITDNGRIGYANYGSRLITQYGTQVKEVEIWNEYNGSYANLPDGADRPTFYTALLKKAYETLKLNHPNVKVGGGAAVLVPLPWFKDLFIAGALNYLDALVIHPYRGVPEGVDTDIANLKALTRSYNNGVEKPIWVTECGIDSADPGKQSMSRYLVRLMTMLRSEGVERISWYLLKDQEIYITGLLYSDQSSFGKNAPTTGYPAYSTLIRILGNATIVRRETTDLRTRMYLFNKNSTELRVLWSISESSTILARTDNPLVVTDLMGNSRTVQPVNGYVSLVVNQDPYYISGNILSVQETGRDLLLADGASGYSGIQGTGAGSWQYGYEVSFGVNPPFQQFTYTPTPYGFRWQQPPNPFLYGNLIVDNGHPDVGYPASGGVVPAPTIRRWISNVTGPISIHGYSRRSSEGGDGTGIAMRIDGNIIYSRLVGPSTNDLVNFSLRANVNIGSYVDFMITPGPATDISFDAVDYSLQISQPFAFGAPAGEPTQDPDGDGLNNRLENALGADPLKADGHQYLPKLLLATHSDGLKYHHFQYRTLRSPGGVGYQVQTSGDLKNWTQAPGTTSTLQDNQDGTWLLEYQEPQSVSDKQQFLRLRVTPPSG